SSPGVSPLIILISSSVAVTDANCWQSPVRICWTRSVLSPTMLSSLNSWVEWVAMKENQTSSLGVPTDPLGALDAVAIAIVPVVTMPQLKSAFTATGIAPPQSSLAGGAGGVPIQTLKVATWLLLAK